MSRVHCRDCSMEVVVDPAGRCPEGHLVGTTGQRIAGSIGAGPRHPDEPEPWVARVVLDDTTKDGRATEVAPPGPSEGDEPPDRDRLEPSSPPAARPAASNGHHTNGHVPDASPVSSASPAMAEDDDTARWQALADMAALAKSVPEPSLRAAHGRATPEPTSPPPPPPAADTPAAEHADSPAGRVRGDQPGLDMASFTAQGTRVGDRGRWRRLGR